MAYTEHRGFDPENVDDVRDLYRDLMAVKNNAQRKISVKKGSPSLADVEEGTMSIRYIPGQGMFLYVKFLNRLYNTRLAEEGRTGIEKIIDNTGGTVQEDVDSTGGAQDDVATLAAKINEVIGKL
jgi:hypothetical protein